MKYFSNYFKTILLAVFAFMASNVKGQEVPDSLLQQMDSVEISLLTCSPGQQIWSLYGHTAIRYQDKAHDMDVTINYGMFDFSQKNFIPKFVFGRTDYHMGFEPFSMFMIEYAKEGRGVVQQRLNLSREEKLAITQAIIDNYKPESRIYRYNFFYDNCTTRARDMIVDHLNGKVEYKVDPSVNSSYRQMVHQWNHSHRWMSFGCDLLLGVGSDLKTDYQQQQFLPDTLRKDFASAMVVEPNGKKHALVDSTYDVLKVNDANVDLKTSIWDTLTPTVVFAALFILTIIITYYEYKRKKSFWLYDVVLLTLTGMCGLCLFAMIFSYHPTVRVNFQILLLNPLSFFFAYSVGNSITKHHYNKYWTFLLVCAVLSLIGGIFQKYAEGLWLLACTLIVRWWINMKLYSVRKKK